MLINPLNTQSQLGIHILCNGIVEFLAKRIADEKHGERVGDEANCQKEENRFESKTHKSPLRLNRHVMRGYSR